MFTLFISNTLLFQAPLSSVLVPLPLSDMEDEVLNESGFRSLR